jgi:hypothetical protein
MDIMVRENMILVLELTKRKKGDEKRWKERGLLVYFFLLFSFSFFLHVTPAMFQTLNLT